MPLPTWTNWYKKPEWTDIREYSDKAATRERPVSPDRGKASIPSRLQLERVLSNKTCSPMSLYDFYMYLKHIEFSDENLEFYMWFKNYESNWSKNKDSFRAQDYHIFNTSHSSLEPSAKDSDLDEKAIQVHHDVPDVVVTPFTSSPDTEADALNHIAFLISTNAVCTATKCRPAASERVRSIASTRDLGTSIHHASSIHLAASIHHAASIRHSTGSIPFVDPSAPIPPPPIATIYGKPEAFSFPEPGDPTKSTSSIPMLIMPSSPLSPNYPMASFVPRTELEAIIKLFLVPKASKELNVPQSLREAALEALRTSSDPEHLRPIANHVYGLLRNCSHRNFVRLGVANGTYETVCAATSFGIVLTLCGFVFMLLRGLTPVVSAHSRWEVFGAWPFWWLGLSLIFSGLRGSCFFLLLFSRRQQLPWERYDDAASTTSGKSSLWSIISRIMIFDRKMRVKDETLRRLQRKIVLQSLFFGALVATIAIFIFFFIPIWRENKL